MGSIPITRSSNDTAGVAELADATDLKSVGWRQPYRFDSGPRHHQFHIGNKPLGLLYNADVAESADALVSGTSGGDIVEVQVLSSAPFLCLILFLIDIFRGRGGIGRRATLRG